MAIFIHIPRTAGTAVTSTFKLPNTHASALARRAANPEKWEKEFKFTIVRNPWAQILAFHVLHQGNRQKYLGGSKNFHDWVRKGLPTHYAAAPSVPDDPLDQLSFFTDEDGNDLVDTVIKFENLQAGIATVCDRMKIARRKLPVINGNGKHRNYRKFYLDDTAEIVAKRYPKFIKRFGYSL